MWHCFIMLYKVVLTFKFADKTLLSHHLLLSSTSYDVLFIIMFRLSRSKLVQYLLNLLNGALKTVENPAATKAQIVKALKAMIRDLTHGEEVTNAQPHHIKQLDYTHSISIAWQLTRTPPESTITHRNRVRVILLFQYKSTSRSKLYLNPLHRHTKTQGSSRHFVNKRTLLRYSLSITE